MPARLVRSALALLTLAIACAGGGPAFAQPGSWPNIDQPLAVDPDESGCGDHRNVTSVFYASDATYLYFRMVTVTDAGWPGTSGSSTEALYKIWFETAGTAASISGTTVSNAEYLLMLEDETTNATDPSGGRDQIGEMTLVDDLSNVGFSTRWSTSDAYFDNTPNTLPNPSTLWRRTVGSGTAGVGGPQQAMTNADIGYRISGTDVDFYVSRASIGNPANPCVIWATDTQSTNIDQAPNCDRPVGSTCLNVVLPTATPTRTPTSTATATNTAVDTATSTPTATNTAEDTATSTPTATNTAEDTATATPTATNTAEDTATSTPTATNTAEDTATTTPTATNTAEDTATTTPTATNTAEDTATTTPTATNTADDTATTTPTATNTAEDTATATATAVDTATGTPTETGTVGPAETPTATASASGTATPTPTDTATPGMIQCGPTPRVDCRTPRKSVLIVQNRSVDRRDLVKFRWRKGAATSMTNPAEFGNPVTTTSYSLCIYDADGLIEELHVDAGGTCGSKPCWKPLRNHLQPPPPVLRAYKFLDRQRLQDGVLKVLLRGGTEGKATVVWKARGPNVPDPMLVLDPPVVAQVINSSNSICWSDSYSGSMVKKNTDKKFKGRRK